MDIMTHRHRYHHYARTNYGRHEDGRGDDDTLDSLFLEEEDNDPLTKLIEIESQLTKQKKYASFKALSADINQIINDNL